MKKDNVLRNLYSRSMTKLQYKRRKHVHLRSSINLAHRAECRERRIAVQDCDCLSDRRLLLGAEHVALVELRLLRCAPCNNQLDSCLAVTFAEKQQQISPTQMSIPLRAEEIRRRAGERKAMREEGGGGRGGAKKKMMESS